MLYILHRTFILVLTVQHSFQDIYGSKVSPLAYTDNGALRGSYETSRNQNQFQTFLGIQYARVTQRFGKSVPINAWDGIKDAITQAPYCAQQALNGTPVAIGVENCLYLNVFTPKADNGSRPVLVYIYGGGFTIGAATEYGGDYLVDEDIVLVTVNYRLGILGFLNMPDGSVAGNMGLKDQVEALNWIQNNIQHFGGDKNRVILSGNSAGSASVLYLMVSPLAQGLFHGIYGMSGTPLNPWAFTKRHIEDAREIGDQLGCNANSQKKLVSCFRNATLESLLVAQKSINKWELDLFRILPSVEIKNDNNPNPFMDKEPQLLFEDGNFTKVPILLTMTKDEGGFIFAARVARNEELRNNLNDNYGNIAPVAFLLEQEFANKSKQVARQIRSFYFDNKVVTREREANLIKAYTDTWFVRGLTQTAYLLGCQTNVYMGLFTQPREDFTPNKLFSIERDTEDVVHSQDLAYIFSSTGVFTPFPLMSPLTQARDIEFSKNFVHLLATFMKKGVPELPFGGNPKWLPVSQHEIDSNFLNWFGISDNSTLLVNPFKERLEFWDNLLKHSTVE